MDKAAAGPDLKEAPILLYQLVCLAGLGLILVPQLALGIGLVEMFLVVLGLAGVLTRWRLAPAVVLGLLTVGQLSQPYLWGGRGWQQGWGWAFQLNDLMLCCGVLAYVAGHFRLQGLASHLLPVDHRLRSGVRRRGLLGFWKADIVYHRRAARLVTPAELALFILTLPLWAVLAQLAWGWLARRGSVLGMPLPLTRFVLLTWLLAVGALLLASFLTYWKRRQMTPAEATLLLQDTLWRETRREQRRLQRWLAWSRLRRKRREEMS
jgi:hypothetical protein